MILKLSLDWIFLIKYLFLFFVLNCSSSVEIYKKPKYGVNLEYLTTSEKFLLDYYSDKETQTKALEKLKSFCEKDSTDFHSCYNLAVLKYHLGEKKEALRYAQLAHERKPDDFLYELMLKTIGLEELQAVNLEGFSREFYDVELACKKGELKNFSLLETWVKSGLITKASLNAGMFGNCLSKTQKEELLKLAKGNPVNYANEYFKEKAKSDPFQEIWDAEHLVRKQNLEEQKEVKAKLTQLWKELRLAVKFSQKTKAKETLQEFLKELDYLQEKHKSKPLAIKLTALKRASYLLVEQDEFFKNNRELLQVFGDKALQ